MDSQGKEKCEIKLFMKMKNTNRNFLEKACKIIFRDLIKDIASKKKNVICYELINTFS